MSTTTHVHLIGGRRFDDFYTVSNEEERFESKLKTKLGPNFKIVNHAVKHFTTTSILNGAEVGKTLKKKKPDEQAKLKQYLAYQGFTKDHYSTDTGLKTDKCIAQPLERVKTSIESAKDATHYVVIDVGVEDVQGYLERPWTIFDIRNLPSRTNQIIDRIKAINCNNIKPIFVIQRQSLCSTEDARNVAIGAGLINLVCIMTFALTAALAVAGKISRLKGGLFSLGALATILAVQTVVPFNVAIRCYKGYSGELLINSIWERLYRPVLSNLTKNNDSILDLATSSYDLKEDKLEFKHSMDENDLLREGIQDIVNEATPIDGSKLVYRTSKEIFKSINEDPLNWSPGLYQ